MNPSPGALADSCGPVSKSISDVQGTETTSALKGQNAQIRGVVSANLADANGYAGFFIEAESDARDSDPKTSEGLFISYPSAQALALGERVAISGKVEEITFGESLLTSVQADATPARCGKTTLPPSLILSAPPENWEALEGMRVRIDAPLSLTGNDELGRYGALRAAFGARLNVPTQSAAPGPEARALAMLNKQRMFIVDDLSLLENPQEIGYLGGPVKLKMPLRAGDQISALEGVVDERFGSYRVQSAKPITLTRANPRPATPPLIDGRLKVASFNVLNLFNGDGLGSGFPTERGAKTLAAFERQKAKTLSAMTALNADIYGLMEIENDGFGEESALAELTRGLNQKVRDTRYDYVRVASAKVGSDQITSAIVYRRDKVKPIGGGMAQVNGPFSSGSRPPLLQAFEEISSGEKFTLVVVHFKSKGGCPAATRPGDQDSNDGQACFNLSRVEAADALLDGLQMNPSGLDDRDFLLIGDFNAYAQEDPMTTFKNANYLNLGDYALEPEYSYVYSGEAGSLDHALVSESLSGQVKAHAVWHINADEPSNFEYDGSGRDNLNDRNWFAPDPYRSSDHDPLLIGLDLNSAPILQ